MLDKEYKTFDRKYLGLLRKYIDDSVFHHVSDETMAMGAWKMLERMYASTTEVHNVFVIKRLYRGDTSIAERVQNLLNLPKTPG